MSVRLSILLGGMLIATTLSGNAQIEALRAPKTVEAGSAFSIQSTGNGRGSLYIIGPGEVLRSDVQVGQTKLFPAGALYNAGHYIVMLVQESETKTASFDVTPESAPARISFLANPSRLPVGQHDGITGAAYVFDAYGNLIVVPASLSFELSSPAGEVRKDQVTTRDGAGWVRMDSTNKEGSMKFVARTGDISSSRVIRQVAGNPCGLKMSATETERQLVLSTDSVLDCSGNMVSDGTIVTFTESYADGQSTVDVPLKRGIAEVKMPAHDGATLSVASGVVLGNQIRWEK